ALLFVLILVGLRVGLGWLVLLLRLGSPALFRVGAFVALAAGIARLLRTVLGVAVRRLLLLGLRFTHVLVAGLAVLALHRILLLARVLHRLVRSLLRFPLSLAGVFLLLFLIGVVPLAHAALHRLIRLALVFGLARLLACGAFLRLCLAHSLGIGLVITARLGFTLIRLILVLLGVGLLVFARGGAALLVTCLLLRRRVFVRVRPAVVFRLALGLIRFAAHRVRLLIRILPIIFLIWIFVRTRILLVHVRLGFGFAVS